MDSKSGKSFPQATPNPNQNFLELAISALIPPNDQDLPWTLTRLASGISRPLGAVAVFAALVIIAGHLAGIEVLYRPIDLGPATHPLTATIIGVLGLSLYLAHAHPKPYILHVALWATIVVCSIRITDKTFGTGFTDLLSPYQDLILDEGSGQDVRMGANSALFLLMLTSSVLLKLHGRNHASQLVAFVSLAIPTASLIGYAYGIENFYGQMSYLTTTIGFVLSWSALTMTPDIGGMRAVLSPYFAGKLARYQAVFGIIIPFVFGFTLVKSTVEAQLNLFGLFVVLVIWFIVIMTTISAIFHEKIDRERREATLKLAKAASVDPLTGLFNRTKFMDASQHELNRTKRGHAPVWVIMIDVDYFKKVNDTAGHAMGDGVLCKLADTLKSTIRIVDILGRWGGEEFCILLSDTNRSGATRVAEHILQAVRNMEVPGWTDQHGPVTVSIGIASSSQKSNMESLLDAADKALYHSKSAGRNTFTFEQA